MIYKIPLFYLKVFSFSMYFLFKLFSGVIGFCSTREYLLLSLLSLEYMVFTVLFSLILVMSNFGYELYFTLMFLVCTACESASGLSILTSLVCNQGNDYLLSILSW